nr:hypothetical protein [Tanacetum cinerariifolium]
ENVSEHSNDPLHSGEDRIPLKELTKLCTKLSDRVLNLETTKTAQAKEIANLKKRVKRLERKEVKISWIKKIVQDIDANQDIYLVNVHRDEDIFGVNDQDDTSMFDADKDLQGEEVIVEKEVVSEDVSVVEEVNAANIATSVIAITTTTATTPIISIDEITLAKALIEIKTSRPKAKRIFM